MALLSADWETEIALHEDLANIRFMLGVNARTAVKQMRECLDEQAKKSIELERFCPIAV